LNSFQKQKREKKLKKMLFAVASLLLLSGCSALNKLQNGQCVNSPTSGITTCADTMNVFQGYWTFYGSVLEPTGLMPGVQASKGAVVFSGLVELFGTSCNVKLPDGAQIDFGVGENICLHATTTVGGLQSGFTNTPQSPSGISCWDSPFGNPINANACYLWYPQQSIILVVPTNPSGTAPGTVPNGSQFVGAFVEAFGDQAAVLDLTGTTYAAANTGSPYNGSFSGSWSCDPHTPVCSNLDGPIEGAFTAQQGPKPTQAQ
jgi:hypothetical protein